VEHRSAIRSDEAGEMQVTVFGKSGCVQCVATRRALDNAGLAYRAVDITEDPDARDYVMALGYLSVPVVVLGSGEHFGGFRPDRIARLAA
jgi:glutaredoxin-like protein NrdH